MTHLPNVISLCRLIAVPFVVLFIMRDAMVIAFWTFLIASFSDAVDGYLARRLNFHTTLGLYLDPLADKVLLMAMFFVLGFLNHVPWLLVVLVLLRDFFILLGYIHLRIIGRSSFSEPLFLSKVNTLLQMFFVVLTLGTLAFHVKGAETFLRLLSYGVMVTTFLSWVGYGKRWLSVIRKT